MINAQQFISFFPKLGPIESQLANYCCEIQRKLALISFKEKQTLIQYVKQFVYIF